MSDAGDTAFQGEVDFSWQSPRARSAAQTRLLDEPTVIDPRTPDRVERAAPPPAISPSMASDMLLGLSDAPERRLLRAAAPLLIIAAELRSGPVFADVTQLRRRAEEEVDRFERSATQIGATESDVITARYALCALIDESVLMTQWGSASEWSTNSLLHRYHNETWGGEKLFVLVDLIKDRAEDKLSVLLVLHACLMFGFEGKYRLQERGREQLEQLQIEVTGLIRRYAQSFEPTPFSPSPNPVMPGRRLRTIIPIWALLLGAILVLALVHFYARVRLHDGLAPLTRAIELLQEKQ